MANPLHSPDHGNPPPSAGKAWYIVGVLMVVYVFSFIDRQLLALMVDPIKADLGVSDSAMGLLMGLSFGLFYTFLGIPLGRIADTHNRKGLIAAGLVLWSIMTAGCGLVGRFWHLFLLRMGVGVGEAALSPAAYSLITDSFPRKRLALALSVYGMGIYLGAGVAYALGASIVGFFREQGGLTIPLLGTVAAWQAAFLAAGLPGFLIALLLLTFREPRRQGAGATQAAPVREVTAYFRANWQAIAAHNLGFAMLSFVGWANFSWIPTFLKRTYGLDPLQAGWGYGAVIFVFGSLGILSGGLLADWLAARGRQDARMRAGVYAALINIPFALAYPLMPSAGLALILIAPTTFAVAMAFGTAPAAIQEMMPNTMRGQASAVYLFVINLIGLGGAPSAVAWCTDHLFRDEAFLRYSLALVGAPACILAALLLTWGLRPFRRTLDRLAA